MNILKKYRGLFLLMGISGLWWACTPQQPAGGDHYSGQLFEYSHNFETHWSSPENMHAEKGGGGKENMGAKGRAFFPLGPGESVVLLDTDGPGIVNRMWITVRDRSPEMLRSLRLEMFWDHADNPAVSVPFGDFFGVGLGRTAVFKNALFANPEGRSFNCFIPMPFKTGAKIVVTNDSDQPLSHIFFDVNFQKIKKWEDQYLYFHARWNRDTATTVGKDFELLPSVTGKGRFLGVNVGVNDNPAYGDMWWGEGEVKIYLDGDDQHPTLVGTGTEDYIGTGWGQDQFFNDYAGCLIADDKNRQWSFYRFHLPDPVFFDKDCKVTLQQMGGNPRANVQKLIDNGVALLPVTIDDGGSLIHLMKEGGNIPLTDPSLPDGWTNFYRSDDVSATAYFYLDQPSGNTREPAPLALRTWNLKSGQ
ncbi:MAG: glycoside hydrolase family 172 protein [Bacteroidia bacterium]